MRKDLCAKLFLKVIGRKKLELLAAACDQHAISREFLFVVTFNIFMSN